MTLELKRTITIVDSDGGISSKSITVDAEEFEKIIRRMVNSPPLPLKTLVKANRKKRKAKP